MTTIVTCGCYSGKSVRKLVTKKTFTVEKNPVMMHTMNNIVTTKEYQAQGINGPYLTNSDVSYNPSCAFSSKPAQQHQDARNQREGSCQTEDSDHHVDSKSSHSQNQPQYLYPNQSKASNMPLQGTSTSGHSHRMDTSHLNAYESSQCGAQVSQGNINSLNLSNRSSMMNWDCGHSVSSSLPCSTGSGIHGAWISSQNFASPPGRNRNPNMSSKTDQCNVVTSTVGASQPRQSVPSNQTIFSTNVATSVVNNGTVSSATRDQTGTTADSSNSGSNPLSPISSQQNSVSPHQSENFFFHSTPNGTGIPSTGSRVVDPSGFSPFLAGYASPMGMMNSCSGPSGISASAVNSWGYSPYVTNNNSSFKSNLGANRFSPYPATVSNRDASHKTPKPTMPMTVRIAQLTSWCIHTQNYFLLSQYHVQAAAVESNRYTALLQQSSPGQVKSINLTYDQYHKQLLDQLERDLQKGLCQPRLLMSGGSSPVSAGGSQANASASSQQNVRDAKSVGDSSNLNVSSFSGESQQKYFGIKSSANGSKPDGTGISPDIQSPTVAQTQTSPVSASVIVGRSVSSNQNVAQSCNITPGIARQLTSSLASTQSQAMQSVQVIPSTNQNTTRLSPEPPETHGLSPQNAAYSPSITPESSSTKACERLNSLPHNVFVNAAKEILLKWYERNYSHPYPSFHTCRIMAEATGMTVDQVKKWFSNRRQRDHNTKHVEEITAARRSRTKMWSEEQEEAQLRKDVEEILNSKKSELDEVNLP